jgi:hypothetical protein
LDVSFCHGESLSFNWNRGIYLVVKKLCCELKIAVMVA